MAKILVAVCLCVQCLYPSLLGQTEQRAPECWKALRQCRDNPSECRGYFEETCARQENLAAKLAESERHMADLEDQLAKAQKQLDELNRERLSAEEREALRQRIAQLRQERSDLQSGNASLQGKVNVLESQKSTLIINVEDLSHRKGVFQNPDLPGRAAQLFDLMARERSKQTMNCTKNGKKVLITNLVLGTLTTSYDSQVAPHAPTRLKLEFEPHSVLSDDILGAFLPDEVVAQWYVRPDYKGQKLNANYDFDESGHKPETRGLSLRNNQKETWIWTITTGKDFGRDVSDLVVAMGYKMATGKQAENDVWRQQIEWREAPGALAIMWFFVTETLNKLVSLR